MRRWYSRPVLFVADVQRALQFYVDSMGFSKTWHEDDGAGKVCQVERAGCEIILCEESGRTDRARLFVSLDAQGFRDLKQRTTDRSIPHDQIWWGYDVVRIRDPDGNELLFPLPGDLAAG